MVPLQELFGSTTPDKGEGGAQLAFTRKGKMLIEPGKPV